MREISSPLTFFYKYIFLLLWFLGFGYGARRVLFFPEAFDARWLQYIAIWLVVAVFIFFTSGSIKKVSIDGRKLIISNYLRTEVVELSAVTAVDGSTFLSPKLVWFTLGEKTPFGRKITFLPRHRMSSGLGKHPLVAELIEELGLKK